MKQDLDLIIEALQKEVEQIIISREECIKDENYLGAHHFSNAEKELRRELQILDHIKNPHNEEINLCKTQITWLKEHFGEFEHRETIKKRINEIHQKILNLEEKARIKKNDDQTILECLELLHKGIFRKIQIILNKEQQSEVHISLDHDQLHIRIPLQPSETSDLYYLSWDSISKLHIIGLKEKDNYLELHIADFARDHYLPVLEILARIYYVILLYETTDSHIYLQIE